MAALSSPPNAVTPRSTGLGAIFLVLFLDLVGFSIVFPLYSDMLGWYSEHDAGLLQRMLHGLASIYPKASPEQRVALFGGVLSGLYSLLQFVAAPIWGRLSDRHGRRPIILISVGGSCVSYLLWIVSGSFTLLLISRLVAGAMGGNISSANAAVADLHPEPKARARAMGLVGMAFALGFILGPAIGGFSAYAEHHWFHLGDRAWLRALGGNPFSLAALVAFLLSLFNLLWAATRFRETLPRERRDHVSSDRTADPRRLFSRSLGSDVVRINCANFLHTLLFSGMEATLVFLTAQRLGYRAEDNVWPFVCMGFVSAAIQGGVFRRLAPRIGGRPLAMAGFLLLMPGFALVALVNWWPHSWLLMCALIILAAGTGLVFPSLSTLVSLASDERRQGFTMGAFRSAGALGRAVGPLLGGLAYFVFSPAAPYLIAAAGIILPLALVSRLRARQSTAV